MTFDFNRLVPYLWLLGAVVLIWIIYRIAAPYFVRIDHVFFCSGAPGTGKDLVCSDYARKRYIVAWRSWKFDCLHVKFHNKFHKKNKWEYSEMPRFYSSIPILIRRRFLWMKEVISEPITADLLLLRKRPANNSVCYISDINRFVNQWSFENPNVKDNLAEFISEYRHYTKDGYFICNAQNSDQVAKEIRNCMGSCINLLHHHHFLFVHWSEMRRISLGEDVKAIETKNNDDKNVNRSNLFLLVNPFFRRYDSNAYYGRVAFMPILEGRRYQKANTNVFFKLPTQKVEKRVSEEENDYSTYFVTSYGRMVFWGILALILGIVATAFMKNGFVLLVLMLVWLYFALER